MRPIDADEYHIMLSREAAHRIMQSDDSDFDVGRTNGIIKARDLIEYAPTVGAAPVVRGEWIGYTASAYMGIDDCGDAKWSERKFYRCNKCRKGSAIKSAYCPGCGAKMREEATP